MQTLPTGKQPKKAKTHVIVMGTVVGTIFGTFIAVLLIFTSILRSSNPVAEEQAAPTAGAPVEQSKEPAFPVGVDPSSKTIDENPLVDNYFSEYVAVNEPQRIFAFHSGWFDKMLGKLAMLGWFQNFASLSERLLVIQPGERKEEVTSHFATILGWDRTEKQMFMNLVSSTTPEVSDGKFYPGTYTVARDAKPKHVAPLVLKKFDTDILSRYTLDVQSVVPLQTSLTIASLLEREAYDFEDMRWVAGVIWNRLFADMKLQVDATLQYAKANKPTERSWWPQVLPSDKYIKSPYNTYQNIGLPPTPIANPSVDSVLAALNPHKTDCMFYFHDAHGVFHCSATYEGHVALLKKYYGQGR